MDYYKPLTRLQVLVEAVTITYFISNGSVAGDRSPFALSGYRDCLPRTSCGSTESSRYTVPVTSRSRTENTAIDITLQIPEQLGFLLPKREVLSQELLEAYAADAYRNEKLTRHEVGQLLGLDRWQFEDFLTRRQAQRPFGSEDMGLERASFRRG